MIKLHISANNFELDDKIVAYVNEKIGSLDKYLPRSARDTQGSVTLTKDPSGREDNQYVAEAIIQVRGPNLQAKEATLNMYAAVDIVAAKIKSQVLKYKQKHSPRGRRAQVFLNKVLGRGQSEI